MRQTFIIAALFMMISSTAQAEIIQANVNGLVCSFCATGLEKTFKAQDAVEQVKVDLDAKVVTIKTKENKSLDDAAITKLIGDAGYTVTQISRMEP